jgi:flagellar biosynthesis/type III secretory pathway protein FliH
MSRVFQNGARADKRKGREAVSETETKDAIEILRQARRRLQEGRVNCARGLAEPYKPGETERLMDTLANIQRTLDTIDRAIADEERAKRSD